MHTQRKKDRYKHIELYKKAQTMTHKRNRNKKMHKQTGRKKEISIIALSAQESNNSTSICRITTKNMCL